MKCKICNQEITQLIENKTEYYFCQKCFFLSKKNIILKTVEDNKNRYLLHKADDNYINYMNALFTVIKPFFTGNSILDFGCGYHKTFTNILEENKYDVKFYDKFFYQTDYQNFKYDNIILIEVIEHIEDPLEVIESLIKLLNNNGNLIIQTNLHENIFENWWYLRDVTHISFFHEKTFLFLSQKYKLNINIIKNSNLIILSSYN